MIYSNIFALFSSRIIDRLWTCERWEHPPKSGWSCVVCRHKPTTRNSMKRITKQLMANWQLLEWHRVGKSNHKMVVVSDLYLSPLFISRQTQICFFVYHSVNIGGSWTRSVGNSASYLSIKRCRYIYCARILNYLRRGNGDLPLFWIYCSFSCTTTFFKKPK